MIRRLSIVGFFAAGILTANIGLAQDIIENPAKPPAANADRKVELKEVLRITDEGGQFYFKIPNQISVSPDNSIFVLDQEELLQFDKSGAYVRNFYKKGQGPGEVLNVRGFIPTDRSLLILGSPGKLLYFGVDGVFVKETMLKSANLNFRLISLQDGVYYFVANESPFKDIKGTEPVVISIPQHVLTWKEGQEQLQERGAFGLESYVVRSGGGGGSMAFTPLLVVPMGSGRLVLSHTQEYLLKIFDPGSGSVTKSFRRPYDRVRYTPPQKPTPIFGLNGKEYFPPSRKYVSDVANLYLVDQRIWVVTSMNDKDQNPLVDVFDLEGRYLDRFFLMLPEGAKRPGLMSWNSAIRDRYLYVVERDEEGSRAIVKYEIIDPGKS